MKIDGLKTYITLLGTFLYAVLSVFYGDMDPNTAVQIILGTGVLGGFRSAMKKSENGSPPRSNTVHPEL